MSEWISVEERLPKYGESVLLWGATQAGGKDRPYTVRKGFRHCTDSAGEHYIWQDWPVGYGSDGRTEINKYAWDVTYWMLCPGPPKEEKQNG